MQEIIYECIAFCAQLLPVRFFPVAGRILGGLAWYILPGRRKLAVRAIADRLEISREKAARIARESFKENFTSFLEIFLSRRIDKRFSFEHIRFLHPDRVQEFYTLDRPTMTVSAHLGAWEVGVSFLNVATRPDRPAVVVVRNPKNRPLAALMTRLRSHPQVTVLGHRNATRKTLRLLRQKGTAGFLVDHNCSTDEAVFLPFLGKIAAVNKGPAVLAVRTQAVVMPSFIVRDGKGGYIYHCEPMLDTTTLEGSAEEKVLATVRWYTQAVERLVRQYPEQWFWMHKRWKTRPPEEKNPFRT